MTANNKFEVASEILGLKLASIDIGLKELELLFLL